jgi:hypothetical protein
MPYKAIKLAYLATDSEINLMFTRYMAQQSAYTESTWTESMSFATGCPYYSSRAGYWHGAESNAELSAFVSYYDGALVYWLSVESTPAGISSASLTVETDSGSTSVVSFSTSALQACEPQDLNTSQKYISEDASKYVYVIDTQNTSNLDSTKQVTCWPITASINLLLYNNFSDYQCDNYAYNLTQFVGFLFNGDSVAAPLKTSYYTSPAST